MAQDDLELANRFRAALEASVQSGNHDAIYPLLAPDVEWVTPQVTLHGTEELKDFLVWGSRAEIFDFEFGEGDSDELGDGRLRCEVHQVYRLKEEGDVAYERTRRIELTIHDSDISRYEMRIVA
jgi:hypothetical protein